MKTVLPDFDDFSRVRVGDSILYTRGGFYSSERIVHRVTRVGAAIFEIEDGRRFDKADGILIGGRGYFLEYARRG